MTKGNGSEREGGKEVKERSTFKLSTLFKSGLPGGSKESACNTRDAGSIPGSGRSLGGGNGNPLQYSCLENPMGRGAWQATVHGVTRVRNDLVTKPTNQALK